MNKSIKQYRLAGIEMIISGENKYAKRLKEYFQGAEADIEKSASITIHVCNSMNEMEFKQKPTFYAEGKGLQVNNTSFIASSGRLRYRVDNLFVENEPVYIWLYYSERRGLRRVGKTFLTHMNAYMIGRESEEDRFIVDALDYQALWWVIALALMKYNRVFVHSGMAAKEMKGVVLSGTGGCGKTSAISEMLNEGWKYIAEDFGVLCEDGSIWQIPKRGAISAEDVSFGSKRLVAIVSQLTRWQKIRWDYYTKKGKNPIIAPSLEKLYGSDNIAKTAKVWKIVCIARSSNEEIVEKKVSLNEIAIRIMGASFRVIREMHNVLDNIQAVADETCRNEYPLMSEIENRYCDIVKKAIENVEYSVLEVPVKVNPKKIKECVLHGFSE